MRQAGLLAASFIVTLTVLSGGFFVMQAFTPSPTAPPAPTAAPATPAPTAAPIVTATPAATASPAPTAPPAASPATTPASATPAPSPAATAVPTPVRTAAPSATASASTSATASGSPAASAVPTGPEGRIQVVVLGSQYSNSTVPSNGSVKLGNGGLVTFRTDRTISDPLELDWDLPESAIPAGFTIRSIDVRICGTGSGDFWETYGPTGSTPDEMEVTAPQADGCWHYTGAPGPETTVKAAIRLNSTMTVARIEYTVTVSK